MNKIENNEKLLDRKVSPMEKHVRDLQIVWVHFFKLIKPYIQTYVYEVHYSTSVPLNMPKYKDTYDMYVASLWTEYCRRAKLLEKDNKDIWEFHLLLQGESEESMKLKYNMLQNAERNLKRELMLGNGYRRKSSEQLAKEKKEKPDYYRVMSPTHNGMGVDIFSHEDIFSNEYELKLKLSSRDILSVENNYNNVTDYMKEIETVELLEELIESEILKTREKQLILDLVLLDEDSICEKHKISKETFKKKVYRLKIKVKDILQQMKEKNI